MSGWRKSGKCMVSELRGCGREGCCMCRRGSVCVGTCRRNGVKGRERSVWMCVGESNAA